jgi:hypothetical protein
LYRALQWFGDETSEIASETNRSGAVNIHGTTKNKIQFKFERYSSVSLFITAFDVTEYLL